MSGRLDALVGEVLEVNGAGAAALMAELLRQGRLSEKTAQECVARAWDLVPSPMSVLTRKAWVALFRAAGYTHEFAPAAPPSVPLVLFRGSDEAGQEGLCWSSNLDVALWFALRFDEGWVWRAEASPWRVLAFMAETYEDQFVVDTTGLEMEVVADPEALAAVDVDEVAARLDALVEARHGGTA